MIVPRKCTPERKPGEINERTTRLSVGGGVLGVLAGWRYEEAQLALASGDHILMYTDGITENRNALDEEFGEERLIGLVVQPQDVNATALTARAIAAASEFSNGNFSDDITVVAISVD